MSKENKMRTLYIKKVTLNVGAGKDPNVLKKGQLLLKHITGIEPVKTHTNKRIQSWGLRPGLPVGCKITLRGEEAEKLLKNLLSAKENVLKPSCFDDRGNMSFGIPEYIDIAEVKYQPEVGIMGLEVSVTLERPGYRVKTRRMKPARVGKNQLISQEEAIDFITKKYNIKVEE